VHFVLLCGVVLYCVEVRAASLFGRVIEVQSGDAITIFNLNRPVRVKLLGVDAPELDQAFGDVARKHLSDLIYDKSVTVEYSGISADGSIAGRVLLNSADIGAQMIRDGVAWFDPGAVSRLSTTDCDVYQQSEQAAHNERRGLWQEENPIAPWDFVRAAAERKNPVVSLKSVFPVAQTRADRPVPELTNLTLMAAGISPRSGGGGADPATLAASLTTYAKNWGPFQVPGQNFSVLMPDEGQQVTNQIFAGDRPADMSFYVAREGWAIYSVWWLKAPTYGETDKMAMDAMILKGVLKGVQAGYERRGDQFSCERQREKNVSMNGYTGREFDFASCSVPLRVRAFTRVVGDERELFFAGVLYSEEEDENVARFINSFTAGPQRKANSRSR